MIQPALMNLDPNEYSQEFHYYPFAVELDRCIGSCNTFIYLSNKVCVPNKTEYLYLREYFGKCIFDRIIFEKYFSKKYFLGKHFWKRVFDEAILKMHFLR